MKISSDVVKYRQELFKGSVSLHNQEVELDLSGAIDQLDSIVKQVNSQYEKIRDAINANETGFRVIREALGEVADDHLPGGTGMGNAEAKYHGQFYIFSIPGSLDELWLCTKDVSGDFTWTELILP